METYEPQQPRTTPKALRNERFRAVERVATRQGGVISGRQLVDLRVSRPMIRRRVARGDLIALGCDVFCVGHRALSDTGRRNAALLAGGEHCALSLWTAAFLWGLIKREPQVAHVSTATRSRRGRCSGVRIHRPRRLTRSDVGRRSGHSVTTIARTILDLAPLVLDSDLRRMIEAAITLHRTDPMELRAYARRAGRRPGAARMIRACEKVAGPATLRSDLESRFRTFCEERGLPPYEANVPFQQWELDAFWRKEGVAVELDTYRYHGAESSFRTDRRKGMAIARSGIHLVRVAGEDLDETPDDVFATLDFVLTKSGA